MESFLKRKRQDDDEANTCPHEEKCYRRNPHHFKEYAHPHLMNFIKKGDPLELPANYPQDKAVVLDQLEILKSLTGMKNTAPDVHKNSQVDGASCSSSVVLNSNVDARLSSRNKPTVFKPSQKQTPSIVTCGKGNMAEKIKNNEPYNLFFTKIPDSVQTHNQRNAISFTDLLCPSLGELKCSLQINFMIDIGWLMEQYNAAGVGKKPLTILYGDEFPDMDKYIKLMLPNVTHHFVKMKDPFGCHHSKIGIYLYSDNTLRVVVSTANLYFEDWNYYCQGYAKYIVGFCFEGQSHEQQFLYDSSTSPPHLWISPLCPVLPDNSSDKDGEGPTGFKTSLLNYLKHYSLTCLDDWINYVKQVDFSAVKVFLTTSVPGKSYVRNAGSHLQRVGDLLTRHCVLPAKTTPESEGPLSWGVIAQASSIGSLGKNPGDWLRGSLLRSLASHKLGPLPANSNATLSIVFPTVENVMYSYYGAQGGGCLPYSKATNEKQKWLKEYLHQWKADGTNRSRAMPHIKSYCRVSPCTTKLAWYLITSSNISKSAWGGNTQKDSSVYVRSYEAGVLFLPKFFGEDYFQIKVQGKEDEKNLFPFIYDIPLTSYKKDDYPWCN